MIKKLSSSNFFSFSLGYTWHRVLKDAFASIILPLGRPRCFSPLSLPPMIFSKILKFKEKRRRDLKVRAYLRIGKSEWYEGEKWAQGIILMTLLHLTNMFSRRVEILSRLFNFHFKKLPNCKFRKYLVTSFQCTFCVIGIFPQTLLCHLYFENLPVKTII